ncbi:pectate lyase superfamily protein-domain-containing protein [Mycena capillaripes]|nr:pectate lyase superfamily protein-domain-containing protein [Mycena capillaripes]
MNNSEINIMTRELSWPASHFLLATPAEVISSNMWLKLSWHTLAALSLFIHSARSTCSGVVPSASASDAFWMGNGGLHTLGKSAYNPGYKVWRNVKVDYGAVGNGIADDTAAINRAISDGGRCGQGCKSSSITPAIVYFPPGTYRITKPIVPFYFTSLVGDFKNKPILKADANFVGVAVIDANPYVEGQSNPDGSGVNWWVNQNNFFRSIRNFVIDTTAMSADKTATGIHWQVGQATSLINLDFKMVRATDVPTTNHQGLFAENGSGGFMSDLTFDGGKFGMWISNQQFTIRNVHITNAATAIYEQWNWGFTWWNINIESCLVGFDIHTGGLTLDTQSTGGVLIVDSWIKNVVVGIRLSSSQPSSLAGSVILDNVQFSNIFGANIQDQNGVVLAASADYGQQWFQGNVYLGLTKSYKRGSYQPSQTRPPSLVNGFGAYFSRSRPQYQDYQDVQFQTVRSLGKAAGDGVTDDTAAINSFLATWGGCDVLFFEAGTYLVTDTIFVPPGTVIVGEMFATIMGTGPNFADQNNPRPVIRVGNSGDTGSVEISDMVITTTTTTGGSAGAIGIEWNIKESSQGAAGMWDVHVRLGGTKGTNINAANCPMSTTDLKCASAFLGIHITNSGSGYFENVWVWNADHDLDDPAETKINSFSGRGVLVESNGPVWLVGTASEHHVIYQYAFNKARDVWAGLMQTETPYFQPTPPPPTPFSINTNYGDPEGPLSAAWGLVISLSSNIFVYGAGLYSFFQTYSQNCVPGRNCQDSMLLIDQQSASIYFYQLTTAGSTNMLSYPNVSIAKQADNINGFASTVSFWEAPQTVPQGQCGVARREVEPYAHLDLRSLLEFITRQSEDYNYYAFLPSRINTELMVGAMDGNGNRQRRQNCVFYVNQQGVDPTDPNYARTRAIQFAALMNAANPGGDYHTLYDVYDNARAFTDTEDPMRSANQGGNRRNWFRVTSAQYARLCEGRLYLIVEEQPAQIWSDSIWVTHEYPAVVETRAVTQIIEIRPSEVGRALEQDSIRYIPHYPYRGPQPPGATPPRDGDKSEIDECAQIDPDKARAKWDSVPEVSGDVAPYKDIGGCTMHIQQWDNSDSGGGGPFDPPPGSGKSYSVEITIFDNGAAHKIGFLSRANAPLQMVSKIDSLLGVDPGTTDGPIQLTLGDQKWNTDDGSCSVGGWDGGPGSRNRNMDCGFACPWNGGDSTDHTPPELWYA